MPYSFTRTAVCLEGYFLKGMPHTFERNTVYTCTITNIFKYSIIQWIFHVFKMMLCISTWFFGASYFMRSTCLSLQNVPYLLMMQGTQEDAVLLGQNGIPCQSKVLYPLVHACHKDMQHRSKHHPIVWTWRNRSKLNSISLWYSLAQYNIYRNL